MLQLVKDHINHQLHPAAEAADLITDWFNDDDLSDEEEDPQENENLPSVVDAARQRQDTVGVCLAAARTAMNVANPAIRIQIFSILLLD